MNNSRSSRKTITASSLYVLDEEFYPDIWKNDQTMSSLMYTFRPKHVNLEHYEQKMQFWKDMIEDYCEYTGKSTIDINELKDVFKRKGTSPYCLQDVLKQMFAEGSVQEKSAFMTQSSNSSWGSWFVDTLVYKPTSWGFTKLKNMIGAAESGDCVYIVKSAVQKQAKLLQNHVKNRHTFNNIVSMDDLMESSENIEGLSREGVLMALQYLSVYEKSAYMEVNNHFSNDESNEAHHHKLLIKFSEPNKTAQPITELERSVYNLESTEKFLLDTINKKELQVNELLTQVKNSLAEGKKQMAKSFLRKKHVCETELAKTMNILDNIQAMLQRIHSSKSDKEILKMYQMGSESIKHIFANNGINLDNVYDIIEDMKEVIEEQEECQSAMSAPMRGINEIDDSELESELLDLLKENNKNGAGPNGNTQVKSKEDLELLDLETRLKKLRGDFPDLDDSIDRPTKSHKSLPQL